MNRIVALFLIAVINFTAAFFQGATGFGYALIAMGLMPLFLPMKVSSAISACIITVIGAHMFIMLHKHIALKKAILPILCCFMTINCGLYMLDNFDELVLRIILASIIIIVTILLVIKERKKIVLKDRWYIGMVVGHITGFSTGMFNIVGPFFLVYYLSIFDDLITIKATIEFTFLMAGLYSTFNHLFIYKNITIEILPEIMVAIFSIFLADYLGLKAYKKMNKQFITKCAYVVLPIMAIVLVIKGLC